jgi:hypothetical protein
MTVRLPRLKEDLLNDILVWFFYLRKPALRDLMDFIDIRWIQRRRCKIKGQSL